MEGLVVKTRPFFVLGRGDYSTSPRPLVGLSPSPHTIAAVRLDVGLILHRGSAAFDGVTRWDVWVMVVGGEDGTICG